MRVQLYCCLALLATNIAAAGPTSSGEVSVSPNQAIVQVNGVVCSFCAYGTEKNLSKLPFLDSSQFGDNGVLIDIHSHRITLAFKPDKKIDFTQIYDAIKKGGYDPVTFFVNVHGQVEKDGNRYVLTCPNTGQVFEILSSDAEFLTDQGLINVEGHINAESIASIQAGQPITINVAIGD